MIPAFLQSLAAQVRALVASGKALHVNEATAAELEILAGLDWTQIEADWSNLAWAWLKLSLAQPSREWVQYEQDVVSAERIQKDDANRAAECAELAALSVRKFAFPWLGTQEGARAAWAHIAACTQGQIADRYRHELEAMR